MGDRSVLTRLASPLTTDPEGTEVALLEVGVSSEEAEAGAVGSPEGEGTEAMVVAALSPAVGAMVAPETTTAAGVRVAATVTGAQGGPTETATTAMVSAAPTVLHCVVGAQQTLVPSFHERLRLDTQTLLLCLPAKNKSVLSEPFCHRTAKSETKDRASRAVQECRCWPAPRGEVALSLCCPPPGAAGRAWKLHPVACFSAFTLCLLLVLSYTQRVTILPAQDRPSMAVYLKILGAALNR